jgi:hypothetical protein
LAQGDTIQAKVGDLVEVSFTLDFKKAAVNQLPNKDKFKFIGFQLLLQAKGKVMTGEPRGVPVTQDDQQITAVFNFDPDGMMGPDFFVAGEKWAVQAGYSETGDNVSDADLVTLGFVQLVAK